MTAGWLRAALQRLPMLGEALRATDELARERDRLVDELTRLRAASAVRPIVGSTQLSRSAPALSVEETAIVDRFHDLYYRMWQRGHNTLVSSWLGYKTLKCPLDMWIYQELLVSYRPDLIIECGTCFGGSAIFMATVCDLLGHGRVLSIDIDAAIEAMRPRHPRIEYVIGSSTDPDIVGEVVRQAAMVDRIIVILDSDHTQAHVAAELEAYGWMVPRNGYLIVEDTNLNGHPTAPEFGPGPMEALDDFIAAHPEFVVDRGLERFLMTCNPRGFLLRTA